MSIIEINAKNERTLKMYSNLIEEIIRSHTDKNKFNTGFSFFKRKCRRRNKESRRFIR